MAFNQSAAAHSDRRAYRIGKDIQYEDLGRALGKLIGQKATIIAHNGVDFCSRHRVLLPEVSGCLSDAVDIGEGEILGNHRAPTISSELNWGHRLEALQGRRGSIWKRDGRLQERPVSR